MLGIQSNNQLFGWQFCIKELSASSIAKHHFLGVPQTEAALAGTLVGLVAVGIVIVYADSVPLAALLSFVIGWLDRVRLCASL